MKKLILLFTCINLFNPINTIAQINIGNTILDTVTVASGLSTPWEMVWAPDSNIWFTERIGKVSRLSLSDGKVHLLLDYQTKVKQQAESGLLGMDVLFTSTPYKVFLVYTYTTPDNKFYEKLVSFDYNPSQDTLINEQVIVDHIQAAPYHDGSRLLIADDYLYMTTGDATDLSTPQDLQNLSGKILRFNLDGFIPQDNPISGSPIYSWGHRNAQGLEYANNLLYSSEHGPNSDDEINIIKKGGNYGWPEVKGFCNTAAEVNFCQDSNVVEPIINWTPTIATSDLIYYDHPSIPEFQGSLLMTTLKNQRVYQMILNSTKDSVINVNEHFTNYWGRLRDIITNPSGDIFIATNSGNNRIIKIFNANSSGLVDRKQNQILIYPSPSNTGITVKVGNNYLNSEITIYSSEGKKVYSGKIKDHVTYIKSKDLSPGIYIVEVQSRDYGITKKIAIQ